MPLQLFRRTSGESRPKPQEVVQKLGQDLCSLASVADGGLNGTHAACDLPPTTAPASTTTTPADGEGILPMPPSPSGASGEEALQRSVSEDVQTQLQVILEVLEEAAQFADQTNCGSSSNGTTAVSGDPDPGSAADFLAHFLEGNLPVQLIASLETLEFEVRKDVISVFSAIVRLGSQLGADKQLQEYVTDHPSFFRMLVDGYDRPEIATHCGIMLRSCARHARLVEAFLSQPDVVIRLLSFTSHGSFECSSDAFSTLHDYLLTHKAESCAFLVKNFQDFFKVYNGLLQSDDYVTQRQGLKLLSETLLDRTFMRVMLMYIGNEQFLQIHMNLLRADSKAIQFEAFHVFKIFVANPQKPPKVQQILYRNREKLIKLLETLRASRPDDRQFAEDQSAVIGKLQALGAGQP